MSNRSDVTVTQISTVEVDLATLKLASKTQAIQPTTAAASTKDAGRVHIGGGSIRF